MNRKQLSHYYGLLLGLFFFGQFLALPILTPLFIEMGANIEEIGVIMAVMGGTVILLEIPTGGLADEIGRKKLFISSLVLNICSLLILCVYPSVIGAILSMLFWGAGISLSSGTITAWFVETYQASEGEQSLQKGFAMVGFRTNLMGACGALLGSLFVYIGIWISIDQLTLFRILLLAAASCYFLVSIASFVWIKEKRVFNTMSKSSFNGVSLQLKNGIIAVSHPVLWRILMSGLLAIPLASAIEKFWQVEFYDITQGESLAWMFGLVFAVTLFLAGLAARVTTWLCDILNQQMGKVLFIGLMCQLLSVIALSLSNHIILFLISFIAFDFSLELGASARSHLVGHATQDKVRSTVDSIMSFVSRTGGVLGTLLCALGASYMGLTNTWLVGAAIASFASVIFLNQTLNTREGSAIADPS
ncbi:multidrug transporter [Marinomonas sp. SBI22]|uniref:MFS transporter n=1 Tax=unclassified Marinomonas TaxID=196814 RepID=UPI0007AF2B62|nr:MULTISPECIES: MFS transporter [unclassified Marinomonas]KZM45158.1 multidrug transporter [Marinomonas sp. SBI22]KZM46856.1 multidrug transporter [Marinomonas sp. SBI8L]